MSGITILIGAQGCGKSHYALQMTKPVNKKAIIVFDVNNEYEGYPNRYTPLDTEIDTFIDVVFKARNAVVIMEDMTGYLSNRGRNAKMIKCLQAHRHSGNHYIILYHSMTSIPTDYINLAKKIVIFKTNDDEINIKKKFSKQIITDAWKEVQGKAAVNPFYTSMPPPKGTRPDFRVVSLY